MCAGTSPSEEKHFWLSTESSESYLVVESISIELALRVSKNLDLWSDSCVQESEKILLQTEPWH